MFALQASDLVVREWPQGLDVRQRSVGALLQTRDGYLWLETGRGLMRFDGINFTAFTVENTPGTVDNGFSAFSLWEDSAGTLWAGSGSHGVVRNDHGHFSTLGEKQGLPGGPIWRIDGDETGAVWIYADSAVTRWQNGRFEQVHPERDGQDGASTGLSQYPMSRDFRSMGLWRHTPLGIQRFAFGHWNYFPTPGGVLTLERDVLSIYEDSLRRVWYRLRSRPGEYFCVSQGSMRVYRGLPEKSFVSFQDKSGYLWLNVKGAENARWKDGKLYPLPEMKSPRFLRIVEEADGTIWAGSPGTAVFQYAPKRIATLPTAGVPEFSSVLFRQRNGDIWAGSTNLLELTVPTDAPQLHAVLGKKVHLPLINGLSEDSNGHLLLSSSDIPGIKVFRQGKLLPYQPRDFDHSMVRAMLLSAADDQWIGTDAGLFRIRKAPESSPERLWSGRVLCLLEADAHTMWVGTAEGPLRFVDGQQQTLLTHLPWTFGPVQSMSLDPDGELWLATEESGLIQLAGGDLRAFNTSDGLPTNNIGGVNADDSGNLWLRSDIGLIRVRRQTLTRRLSDLTSKLRLSIFDQADGFPAPNTSVGNQRFLRLNADTYGFATAGGIALVHPSKLLESEPSPRAILEEHTIDQVSRLSGLEITLQPSQKDLELHYTALGSRRPEQVYFRYRLHGYDQGWIVAGSRRVAYYTQLPPGTYTFQVQAANGDEEVWEAAGASAQIHVLAPLYRTWWFRLLVFAVLLSSLIFVMELRRRGERERNRLRQAFTHKLIATQEGERKRIAHELHDSLGQHLVLIRTLALLPATQAVAAGDHLAKIADQSAVAIEEIESISYDLRPYQLDRLGLTTTLISLVEHFEASDSVSVTHSVENIDGFFPKHLEINVYRIVQEALSNVLKHAQATQVSVNVSQNEFMFRLVVEDNGRGFSHFVSGQKSSGLGLIGIQERAEAIGGQAHILPADPQGTKVVVTVSRKGS